MRKVRIGIDVGGTFTDAVAIDDATYEIIAQEKLPTTHRAEGGVAEGIIKILQNLLSKNHIAPEEVVFIAHGTTQATNALLEGDVAKTGILAMGTGIESTRVKADSAVDDIPLAQGKALHTVHAYVETERAEDTVAEIQRALINLKEQGARVIVATESFGVDDPANEEFVMRKARSLGLFATGGHEVSTLYGLRVRTRTAVINGSLIPKMMETADMTEACVKRSGIPAPLMIMRCDGGVMTIDEVRHRPILTMLSGLAAGVAGALMYEGLSDGIFLESGGTSTDISVIRNGQVMVRYAEVGGHKTYLNSLDVRTLGVAGGSMIGITKGKITEIGPRSAHIAGLDYEVFSVPLQAPHLITIAPCAEDAAIFAAVEEPSTGRCVALTLAGAANVLGFVPEKDYARGDRIAAQTAWQALGDFMGISAEMAAKRAMDLAVEKIKRIVEELITEYHLSRETICLAGGGGSGGIIVPYLGNVMNLSWKIVRNAPIISTIGVALAMVRETVERTVSNPTQDDIRAIRHEALEKIMRSGASEETVDISIEIDKQANILRAIASGATELRTRDLSRQELSSEGLLKCAAHSMKIPAPQVQEIASVGKWHFFEGIQCSRRCFFFTQKKHLLRVLDREGIVRLQKDPLGVMVTTHKDLFIELTEFIDMHTEYGTAGAQLPLLHLYYGEKQIDLSGLISREQIDSVLEIEVQDLPPEEVLILAAVR